MIKTYFGGKAAGIEIKSNLDDGIKKFKKVSKDQDFKGKTQMGFALMNAILNGSSRERVVPPVATGHLRGSGSLFVGGKLVGEAPKFKGRGIPNKSFRANDDTITVGFNTEYAVYTHEKDFIPGPVSQQSGDVGNKWMEKHLMADKEDLMKLYGTLMEKRLDSDGI